MRRKLLIVNLVLVALAAGGLWKLRIDYRRSQERYRILNSKGAAGQPVGGEPAAVPAVQPGSFIDAADKYLLSADRNPTVVIEQPKPKPRPALPVLFGVMKIGNPIAILAEKPGAAHKTVRLGETIGEFKLAGAAGDEITLEWEGQSIKVQVSDVQVKPSSPEPAVAQDRAPIALPGASTPPSPPPVVNVRPGEYPIGPADVGAGGKTIYSSLPGDTAPPGTVYQNKVKVVRETPFGKQSWWEDVKK